MESVKTRFFGRKALLEDVVQGVLTPGQPIDFSLVGPKMIGKTKLLKYLAAPDGPLLGPDPHGWRPERFQDGNNVIVGLYNCTWPEARVNLPQFLNQRLRLQLESEKSLHLDWSQIERAGSPGQQIVQVARQLDQQDIRLLVMLDNFDNVLVGDHVTTEMVNELRPLTNELALLVTTSQPLHDLNQTLAASPLFNLMHQHFVGLLTPDAAQAWVEAYGQRVPMTPDVQRALLEMVGGHPLLLARSNEVLLEIQSPLPEEAAIDNEHLSLLRLRLYEQGRPLFEMLWRKLKDTTIETVLPLVKHLAATPVAIDQIPFDQTSALNWLINYAAVTHDGNVYHLFSPLFQDFLADQLGLEQRATAIWPVTAATVAGQGASIFDSLAPKEAELLRYFQAHNYTVLPVEQLLADVWHQPEASPRRVQEAIRRLRNRLNKWSPPVGVIENERGVGYRYVPARTGLE